MIEYDAHEDSLESESHPRHNQRREILGPAVPFVDVLLGL
jgi:hypothetical protein